MLANIPTASIESDCILIGGPRKNPVMDRRLVSMLTKICDL